MDEANEELGIEDIPFPMSVNQTVHSVNQSVRKRKGKPQVDIVADFIEVAAKMCLSFQQKAKERMRQFSESMQPITNSYPKYLAVDLKRLRFSTKDNLNISKTMRMDSSNVEVFKIIETNEEKRKFAMQFQVE